MLDRIWNLVGRLRPWMNRANLLRAGLSLIALLWLVYLARTGWVPERGLLEIPASDRSWPDTEVFTSNAWTWAAWVSLVLCGTGIALAPWLARNLPVELRHRTPGLEGHLRWSFPLVALASVLLSLWIGLPRMNHSLWGDENENFRQYAVGYFYTSKNDGEFKYREMELRDAAFRYKDTNNHQLYAVLGRWSHQLLGGLNRTDPHRPYMTEWKYRLPALVGSLAGIVLVGWLMVRLGLPRGGMLTMPLLALHPWFVRYATEARGYALLFALGSLCLLFLISAIRTGRRRDWIGFGLVLSLESLAFMGYAFGYAIAGAAAVPAILAAKRSTWMPQFGGLALGAISALLLWMPAYFPCLPGMVDYLTEDEGEHQHLDRPMTLEWYENELTLFATGASWREWDRNNPNSITVEETPWPVWPTLITFAVLVLVGAVRLALKPRVRWLLLPLLLAAPTTVGIFELRDTYVYPWYLVTALPDYVGLAAVGLIWPLSTVYRRWPNWADASATLATIVGVALFFAWETRIQREVLRHTSLEPIRESTEFMRTRINSFLPPDEDVITVGAWARNKGYDDRRIDIETPRELRELMEQARREDKRLYVDIGQIGYARKQMPGVMRLLENPRLFDPVATFWSGQEVQNTRNIFQMRDEAAPEVDQAAPGE